MALVHEIEYSIVTANDTQALVKEMNERQADGWEPHGSLIYTPAASMPSLLQPVTRKVVASRPNFSRDET